MKKVIILLLALLFSNSLLSMNGDQQLVARADVPEFKFTVNPLKLTIDIFYVV